MGAFAALLPHSTTGKDAVAAGAIVLQQVPESTGVSGFPARVSRLFAKCSRLVQRVHGETEEVQPGKLNAKRTTKSRRWHSLSTGKLQMC